MTSDQLPMTNQAATGESANERAPLTNIRVHWDLRIGAFLQLAGHWGLWIGTSLALNRGA